MQFGAILGREGYVGEDVVLTLVDQGGKLGPARPQLIGGLGIGLQECLADRGSDHRVLAFAHTRQGVSHPVHAAPLPGRAELLGANEDGAYTSTLNERLTALERQKAAAGARLISTIGSQ